MTLWGKSTSAVKVDLNGYQKIRMLLRLEARENCVAQPADVTKICLAASG